MKPDQRDLIAESSKLLQACRMMLEKFEFDVYEDESGWDAVVAAREAIAAATTSAVD